MKAMEAKKLRELVYLEEARRASPMFPVGEPIPSEPLDFLLPTASGMLGVEITELCRATERHQGARLGYVAPKAKKMYQKHADATPRSVSPVFANHADQMHVEALAYGLAEFVYRHRNETGTFSWEACPDLPEGYSQIGVFEPIGVEDEEWRYFQAFDVELASRELIAGRIAEKNQRVSEYRKMASTLWLLIINDLFLGPGEVSVRADDLALWTFDFAFDKALLFERQPGGSGHVTELRRR